MTALEAVRVTSPSRLIPLLFYGDKDQFPVVCRRRCVAGISHDLDVVKAGALQHQHKLILAVFPASLGVNLLLDRLGLASTVRLELGLVASDKTVMPDLGLLHA